MNMADPPRTVLISGCSSGIGLQLAVQLARDPRQRYQVVATMRDLGKKGTLEEAAGEALGQTLTVAQLDVCSDESVAQCLSCIRGGEVDVLVNNAGVGLVGPLEGLSLTSMQKVFDTNFFGAVRLVKAVLPGMKRRRQGHIVVVSSVMGLQDHLSLWTHKPRPPESTFLQSSQVSCSMTSMPPPSLPWKDSSRVWRSSCSSSTSSSPWWNPAQWPPTSKGSSWSRCPQPSPPAPTLTPCTTSGISTSLLPESSFAPSGRAQRTWLRLLSRSSARPARPCADRPTPATLH
ncbi:retinol dehydrogenase 8 isoform X4 [Phyllostomus discolor]|uniref:Retinol dehydrogenase 8 isoform X4 n=1 Tax=Phyllostomus discolor TaxID=89673 RepID=A0A7E6EA87_9CHIR|nr:retinol dehydrogenase 8 isoform X4 [Phyllostomus discolor]